MTDFSMYRMSDWEWYEEYRSRMGKEELNRYIDRVYELLMRMKPGGFFFIEKIVNPENLDLFIKICCMFIIESRSRGKPFDYQYTFSDDYLKISYI